MCVTQPEKMQENYDINEQSIILMNKDLNEKYN